MAYSVRVSNAMHILVNVARAGHRGEVISSFDIARRLNANASQIRQIMGKLRNAGMIYSGRGTTGTYLARDPWEISLLDVYRAVEGDAPMLHLSTGYDENPVSEDAKMAIKHAFDRTQSATNDEMASIKLEDIMRDYYEMESARPESCG